MSKRSNSQEAGVVEEATLANSRGKTLDELKEIAQTLQTQLQEHNRLGNYHTTMATKAQGALEVISQMIPLEENKGEES